MCSTCGCGEGNVQIEGHDDHHSHEHHHHHDDDHHSHGHHHHHDDDHHEVVSHSQKVIYKHNYKTKNQPIIIHHHHYHGDVHNHYYASDAAEQVITDYTHDHSHEHNHDNNHDHSHEHNHEHHHEHEHELAFSPEIQDNNMDYGKGEAGTHAPGLGQKRMLQIEMGVLDKNNEIAAHNRQHFEQQHILALNLVSSPGSGKTTLLVRTLRYLADKMNCAVIEGDQQTTNDAERIRATGVPAIQVNTGKGCHLDAQMVHDAVHHLQLADNSLLFIENVGNLVCPASFDLGEKHKVAILSVTEGEDKPLKYPHMFMAADLMIINKIDLLPYVDVNIERCVEAARQVNPDIDVIVLSASTGEGMDEWVNWLETRL